ncbi:RHS repeat-associated core domain-containing protein [Asanoa sp. NPDC049518]|uniref:RHS repeat-associated core domain-containing protein n=1 Tax=unclassified Asanoa TaxID=2685164 RepID=UPI00343B092B
MAGVLLGGLLVATSAQATPGPARLSPQAEKLDSVGAEVRTRAWPYTPQKKVAAPAPVWPTSGVARVAGPGGERVSDVTVRVLDRATAPAAWRDGLLLRVERPAAKTTGRSVRLSVSYAAFRYAYGADWASRLRLWRLPECAVASSPGSGCAATPLPSTNDEAKGVVTAPVSLEGSNLIALAAGPAGSGGDFTATSLAPSATWSAGGNSGDFSWSYPMEVPPAPGGPAPDLSIAYSSSSVDGRSAVTNNQPSWIGEGFDYWPGYIERRYVPCSDDMASGANNTTKTGDQCWRSDNAVLNLGGGGTELVYETGKGWHGRSEDGSRIEKLTGGGNGDNDGEYWKVTTAEGTQYFFGRHNLPGQSSVTDSTWTVPVAGNHTGEPCRQSSFTASFCTQAWRWNLDYVVDVRGNTMSYWYAKETNKYARNVSDSDAVSYVRGGTLTRIDYGTWDRGSSDRRVTPSAQVLLGSADRCVTTSCGTHDATNWPDTPWDQECTGSTCAKKYSPTFWSTKRLASVTTRVWDTTLTTPAWQNVSSWTLTHSFPPPGDGSDHAGLWLDKIQQAGLVGSTVTMPPITFTPVSLPNRVLTSSTTTNNWQRIDYILTETGAKVDLEWDQPQCTATNKPSAAHTNTMRCYPVLVVDPDDPQGKRLVTEWWHKHRVKSVSESDLPADTAGHPAPPTFTYYEYGTPAWHYADDDGLTKPDRKTWDQFRGYGTVRVRVGDVAGAQTLTELRYLQGMHGDRLAPTGGTRSVTVPASLGSETVYDEDQFAGMVREEVTYNGVATKPLSKTVSVPWMSPPTASRTINGDTVTARFTDTKTTYAAVALGVDGARGWRTGRTQNWLSDTYGTVERSQDDGDLGRTGDETCTSYVYNRGVAANLLNTVKQTTTTALPCGTAPTSQDHIISDVRNYYDGASSVDAAPTLGSVTKTERLKDWTAGGGTVWQTASQSTYDKHGRAETSTDVRGNTTRNAYTPSVGGPVTRITTTGPAPYNWVTVADTNPYWGSTKRATDQNGQITDISHDALGRVWRVWNAGWSKADHGDMPSTEYTYTLAASRNAYPYTTSKVLHAGGGYRVTYEIMDTLLRPRQQQTAGIGGDRVVTDTLYDKLGRAALSYSPHAEPGNPSGTLWWEPEWSVPAVTRTDFDNANRPVATTLLAGDGVDSLDKKWGTTTSYEGDRTAVTPPAGGTPTTTITDYQGRTVELRQHTTAQGVAGDYQSTRYTFNGKGQQTMVRDHDDNRWTYTFDVKGRQVESVDPDKGSAKTEYNEYDEVERTTDARGESLWHVYDTLGRKIELRDDSATGRLRTKQVYDKLYTGSVLGAKGQLTEALRYEYDQSGAASVYKWQVGGFTVRSQPSNVNYVIPPVEGSGLATTWSIGFGYSQYDGSQTSILYPGGGGLTNETVTTAYQTATGLPATLKTNAVGVASYVTAQDYTRFGEPTKTTRMTSGGRYVEDTTSYDEVTRRVRSTVIKPEGATGSVSNRSYDYEDFGTIRSIADTPAIGSADTQCFRHDFLRRLTSAWTTKPGVSCGTDPTVANLGGPAPYWLDWTFDAAGNRRSEVSHTAAGDTIRSYTVPTGGPGVVRPHAVTRVTTTAPGQAAVVTNYAYDNSGNTTCRPGGSAANTCPPGGGSQDLAWDAEGRLAKVTVGGQAAETNIYGVDGTRLIRRDATGTTLYLPGQELRRDTSGNVTGTRYYTFAGRLVASRNPAGLTWLYTDHQGTQHTSINAATQAVTARRQTPYGQPRGTNPGWPNGKGFVGGDTDPVGLTHLGAREYDAALGRFVSVDPVQDLTDPQQWNGYSYANNSPVTMSDPTGLIPADCREFDCYGYDPRPLKKGDGRGAGGCPGGCGTKKNKSWGKKMGLKSTKTKRVQRAPSERAKRLSGLKVTGKTLSQDEYNLLRSQYGYHGSADFTLGDAINHYRCLSSGGCKPGRFGFVFFLAHVCAAMGGDANECYGDSSQTETTLAMMKEAPFLAVGINLLEALGNYGNGNYKSGTDNLVTAAGGIPLKGSEAAEPLGRIVAPHLKDRTYTAMKYPGNTVRIDNQGNVSNGKLERENPASGWRDHTVLFPMPAILLQIDTGDASMIRDLQDIGLIS